MAARDAARGLPIAAHLGLLVALAFVSAFVGVFAVVIWLPPRPPDVMRADMVGEHFLAGYRYMVADGHTLPNDDMVWAVSAAPPAEDVHEPAIETTRAHLADALDLRPDQIRMGASNIDRRSEVFVFRVQDVERHSWCTGKRSSFTRRRRACPLLRRKRLKRRRRHGAGHAGSTRTTANRAVVFVQHERRRFI